MMILLVKPSLITLKLKIPINPTLHTAIPTISIKPTKTDRNRHKPTLLTSKTDETDKNRQKNRRFVRRFCRFFSMQGDNINNSVIVWSIDSQSHSFALSGLSNHCRTISDCSRYLAQFRTISRNFDSYSNYCLDCRVMGVLRLDRLVHTSTTSTRVAF